MDRSNNLSLLLLLLLISLVPYSLAAGGEIVTPEELLAAFYEGLLSERPTDELPPLFADPTIFATAVGWPTQSSVKNIDDANEVIWNYLRENRSLFLFEGIEPLETLDHCRRNYCFLGVQNGAVFFDRIFCVELVAGLSSDGKEGVFKQIRFPLQKSTGALDPHYLFEVSMITINGVTLDPSKDYKRSGSFYNQLGFAL